MVREAFSYVFQQTILTHPGGPDNNDNGVENKCG
jgi:hypothetical protein